MDTMSRRRVAAGLKGRTSMLALSVALAAGPLAGTAQAGCSSLSGRFECTGTIASRIDLEATSGRPELDVFNVTTAVVGPFGNFPAIQFIHDADNGGRNAFGEGRDADHGLSLITFTLNDSNTEFRSSAATAIFIKNNGGAGGDSDNVATGPNGGRGGNGGGILIDFGGHVRALGQDSVGLSLDAPGGSGGDGSDLIGVAGSGGKGARGGSGGSITGILQAGSQILVFGNDGGGVIATANGGDGGRGGDATAASATGGKGGQGGLGGSIGLTIAGNVDVEGANSIGVAIQSVGGDGGRGGSANGISAQSGRAQGGANGGNVSLLLSGRVRTGFDRRHGRRSRRRFHRRPGAKHRRVRRRQRFGWRLRGLRGRSQ
jgi:hypothetical protein